MSGYPYTKTPSSFYPPLIYSLVVLPTCWNYRKFHCSTREWYIFCKEKKGLSYLRSGHIHSYFPIAVGSFESCSACSQNGGSIIWTKDSAMGFRLMQCRTYCGKRIGCTQERYRSTSNATMKGLDSRRVARLEGSEGEWKCRFWSSLSFLCLAWEFAKGKGVYVKEREFVTRSMGG